MHVSIDPAQAEAVRQKWEHWGGGVRLVILESPYRLLLEPLLQYIAEIAESRQRNETITIVVPQFVLNELAGLGEVAKLPGYEAERVDVAMVPIADGVTLARVR